MKQKRVQECTHINTANSSLTRQQRQNNGANTVFSTNGAWSSGCVPASCFSHVRLFSTLWTTTCQAPLSTGFSRQECWSGLPCPPPGGLPDPGVKPTSPATLALQADSLLLSHQESLIKWILACKKKSQSRQNLTPSTITNSKWITDLSGKHTTVKLLEDNKRKI